MDPARLRHPRERDAIARSVVAPSLAGRARLRAVVGVLAVPAIVLAAMAHAAVPSRLVVDVVLASLVARELVARTPDVPRAAAAALFALALDAVTRALATCGHAASSSVAAAALATAAGSALLFVAAPRERVVLELGDRLGVTPDALATLRDAPPGPAVRAYAAHAGLALALALTSGERAFFRAGIALARCTARLDADGAAALAREEAAWASTIASARHGLGLVAWLVVVPVASELLRAGALVVARRRLRRESALLATAVLYAVLHAVVLHGPLATGLLLGLAFGIALLEGGLVAALAAHVAYRAIVLL